MANISNLNSVLTLSANILPLPQNIQGFAADDAFATTAVKPNEVLIGVDNFMSYGAVAYVTPMSITLQADSPSNAFFDAIIQQQNSVNIGITVVINGTLLLQSTGNSYNLTNGVITDYMPIPGGKKLLQPRKFEITWNIVTWIPQAVDASGGTLV